jgi:DNA-binding MarR family transcriptional regulator
MNKTVELVRQWGEFEEKHPDGSIADFCRYQLIHQREKENKLPLAGGVIPMIPQGLMLKLIGRIHRLNATYAYSALEGTGVDQLEEFGMLLYIQQEKRPRKTDVIYAHLMELSSGTDMLNRLKSRGFINEYTDREDKRSKRLQLTASGEKTIEKAIQRVKKLATMVTHGMPEEDVLLCIKLLKGIDQEFSALLSGHKGKSFDEVYGEVMPGERDAIRKRAKG